MKRTKEKKKPGTTVPGYTPELGTRISDLIKKAGGLGSASKLIGISGESLAQWRDGRARPSLLGVFTLAQACNTSVDWVLTGEGPMLSADVPAQKPEQDTISKHLAPASQAQDEAAQSFCFDRFDLNIDMPVRGYAKCSLAGHLEKEGEYSEIPAPEGIRQVDPDSFYVIAKGQSMIPEGINEGDYCLISPNTSLKSGQRVWLKDREGLACIKRLAEDAGKSYRLRGWLGESASGRQQSYHDEWFQTNLAQKGVVLAVLKERPDIHKKPQIVPDPKIEAQSQKIPVEQGEGILLPAHHNLSPMGPARLSFNLYRAGIDLYERLGTPLETEDQKEEIAERLYANVSGLLNGHAISNIDLAIHMALAQEEFLVKNDLRENGDI